jgi:hypothetical protein
MSALARPAVLAPILAAAGLALHPALGASRWLPGRTAVLAALLLLAALALVARAAAGERRTARAVTAAGAILLVAALAVDGVRGRHGTLTLAAGQSRANFDEEGLDGRPLGLRPLGFPIGAGSVGAPAGAEAAGTVALALPGRERLSPLTPGRAVAFGGYRFARPRSTTIGGVSRLRVAMSDGATTQVVEVGTGAPGRIGGLTISLAQYFPDFALDDQRRPFTRSTEPRNPAALLDIEKGRKTYRAFVLQSMPGIHRVEELGLAFSLLGLEPEREVEIAVHREPFALAVLAGALLLAAGLALSLPRAPGGDDRQALAPVAGFVLVALLLLADRGAILAWSFGVRTAGGRQPLPGVGVLLGATLLAALGGSLLLAAGRLAGTGEGVERAGRAALWVTLGAGAAGLLLAAARVAALPGEVPLLPLGGIAAALALVGAALAADCVPLVSRASARVLPLAVLGALLLAAGAGVSGVLRDGTYATPLTAACGATALFGLAGLEPTRGPGPRRFAFLLSLLALAVV